LVLQVIPLAAVWQSMETDTIVIGARWDDTENGYASGSAYLYIYAKNIFTF